MNLKALESKESAQKSLAETARCEPRTSDAILKMVIFSGCEFFPHQVVAVGIFFGAYFGCLEFLCALKR